MVSKTTVRVLVLAGYGLNCEEETAFAFSAAGADTRVVHLYDLIKQKHLLIEAQILVFPGGFSFGDDMGSGRALANIIKTQLMPELIQFKDQGNMILGICNGFQVLTQLGLLPGALLHNDSARFIDSWVDVPHSGLSPWLEGLTALRLPIAHGEGRYHLSAPELAAILAEQGTTNRSILRYQVNPNGSLDDIAGLTDETGLILGLMPHPERAIFSHHLPDWTLRREAARRKGESLAEFSQALTIFQNAVQYMQAKKLTGVGG